MTVGTTTRVLLLSAAVALAGCSAPLVEDVDVRQADLGEDVAPEVVSASMPDGVAEVASANEPDAADVAPRAEPDVAPRAAADVTSRAAADAADAAPVAEPDVAGETSEEVVEVSNAPVQILALGDSYTIGSGGVAEADRWPNLLAGRLQSSGLTVDPPQFIAHMGWTTTNLLAAMDAAALVGDRDLVTLLIGVNNQYQGASIDAYRTELIELLTRAVSLAGDRPDRVLVVSIPDYGVTPFAANSNPEAISAELDAFNAVGLEEANAAGVHWIDIVDISRQAATDLTLLAPDGLHPSGAMYALWAERVAPVALGALQAE
ncbi:MAG: GDSL-type esterase/lipase family protein [Myxococcota bacterium]|nr:GDSL-type esterase/lipase family protein [Myxococcota bacterium]